MREQTEQIDQQNSVSEQVAMILRTVNPDRYVRAATPGQCGAIELAAINDSEDSGQERFAAMALSRRIQVLLPSASGVHWALLSLFIVIFAVTITGVIFQQQYLFSLLALALAWLITSTIIWVVLICLARRPAVGALLKQWIEQPTSVAYVLLMLATGPGFMVLSWLVIISHVAWYLFTGRRLFPMDRDLTSGNQGAGPAENDWLDSWIEQEQDRLHYQLLGDDEFIDDDDDDVEPTYEGRCLFSSDGYLSRLQVKQRLDEIAARRSEALNQFARMVNELPRYQVAAAREELVENLEQLEQSQRRLAAARAELARRERAAESMGGSLCEVLNQFEQLCQHPQVRAIDANEEKLVFYFKTIYITSRKGARFEIGDFCLECNLADGQSGTKCLRSTNPARDHPFGYSFGICFGIMGNEQITEFLMQGDYWAVVDLVVAMLTRPGPGLNSWKEVDRED